MTTTTQTLECPRCNATGIEERDVYVGGGEFSLQLTRCGLCDGRRHLPYHRNRSRPRPYRAIGRAPVPRLSLPPNVRCSSHSHAAPAATAVPCGVAGPIPRRPATLSFSRRPPSPERGIHFATETPARPAPTASGAGLFHAEYYGLWKNPIPLK